MKILVVTHYYDSHGGGVEIVAGSIIKALLKKNDLEILWASSDVDRPPHDAPRFKTLPMKADNSAENKIGIPYPFWTLGSIAKLFKAVKSSDIVHIHDYAYFGNIAAFIAAKICKKKVILTQHIGFVPYKNIFFRALLSLMNRTVGFCMTRTAQKTVFISDTVRRYFGMTKAGRSCFIANGVDGQLFRMPDETQRKNIRDGYSLAGDRPVVIFVGRFVEKKGLYVLEKLARRMKDVEWVFAGWGKLDPGAWGLKNVRVFYRMEKEKIADLYKAADLLVLPSVGEGFPLVVQEAMSCGTPAVVNEEVARAYPAAKEIIFFVDPSEGREEELWKEKLEIILSDRSVLRGIREKTSEFASRHWDWDKCAGEYYALFKS